MLKALTHRVLLTALAVMIPGVLFAQDFQPPSPFAGWTVLSSGLRMRKDHIFGHEVHIAHIFDKNYHHFHPIVDFSFGNDGGTWFGAGVYVEGEMPTNAGNLFVGASFAPGFYIKGSGIDLGYPLLFRSTIEAGIKTESGYRISLTYDHRSNGNISRVNPGMETLQLRIGKHFN